MVAVPQPARVASPAAVITALPITAARRVFLMRSSVVLRLPDQRAGLVKTSAVPPAPARLTTQARLPADRLYRRAGGWRPQPPPGGRRGRGCQRIASSGGRSDEGRNGGSRSGEGGNRRSRDVRGRGADLGDLPPPGDLLLQVVVDAVAGGAGVGHQGQQADEHHGVNDGSADVGGSGSVRTAEPFGHGPDQDTEGGSADIG